MTTINTEVLIMAGDKLKAHLLDYERMIEQAYLKLEEGALTVNLSAKFSESSNCMKVETGISFVADKVKDKGTLYYDPDEKKKPKQMKFDDLAQKRREILFRDFSELRKILERHDLKFWFKYRSEFGTTEAVIKFRTFDMAA